MGERFETYRLARGEYFDERVPDLSQVLEKHFDAEVDLTTDVVVEGQDVTCHIAGDVGKDGLKRVIAGKVSYPSKKSELAVRFVEKHPRELSSNADPSEAINAKNEFLHAVTGRTAEDRREDMKNDVED